MPHPFYRMREGAETLRKHVPSALTIATVTLLSFSTGLSLNLAINAPPPAPPRYVLKLVRVPVRTLNSTAETVPTFAPPTDTQLVNARAVLISPAVEAFRTIVPATPLTYPPPVPSFDHDGVTKPDTPEEPPAKPKPLKDNKGQASKTKLKQEDVARRRRRTADERSWRHQWDD